MRILIYPLLFVLLYSGGCNKSDRAVETNKRMVQDIFRDVVIGGKFDQRTIEKYYDPNYTQKVDGKTLYLGDFVSHMKALHESLQELDIVFEHMIAEGNKVSTVHHARGKKRTGGEVTAKVIALFEFKNDRLVLCDELTMITSGDQADKDIGSRTN